MNLNIRLFPFSRGLTVTDVKRLTSLAAENSYRRFANMMNCGGKTAISSAKSNLLKLQTSLFHSTPVLERKRRNFWDTSRRSSSYSWRSKRLHAKDPLFRDISDYADRIFQSWKVGFDEEDPSSSRSSSWFKQQNSKGSKRGRSGNQSTCSWGKKGGFSFVEDEDDFEPETFRSTFGGNQYFYWTFINGGDDFRWKSSSRYSRSYGWNWRYRVEEDYDFSSESDSDNSESNLASDRLALGLSASGPLKLKDVKNAYQACALKWHPDRHQGSSKAVAEEKFKQCSAAYQSLCDELDVV